MRAASPLLGLTLSAALVAFSPARARAGEPPPEATLDDDDANGGSTHFVGAEVDLASRFVWRGIAFGKGAVAQPSVWGSRAGFTATVWANLPLNETKPGSPLTSVVPTLGYAYEWRALKIEPGAFVYASPNGGARSTTAEASFDISYRLGPVRLVSGTKVDVAAHPGAYFGTLGTAYERSSHRWTLRTRLDVGWANARFNQAYVRSPTAAFELVEGALEARYDLTDFFYVSPHTEVSALLVPAGRSKIHERVLINGGAALGVQF